MSKKIVEQLEKTIISARVYKTTAGLLKAYAKDRDQSLSETVNEVLTIGIYTISKGVLKRSGLKLPFYLKHRVNEIDYIDRRKISASLLEDTF